MTSLSRGAGNQAQEREVGYPDLIIFDLDGTLIEAPDFYQSVYSYTLEQLIEERFGNEGLELLAYYRQNYDGKGELALEKLGIPFNDWAQKLIKADLRRLSPRNGLVEKLRSVSAKKAVYTGSPSEMAKLALKSIGFEPAADFDQIIGWEPTHHQPEKWSCSPAVFSQISVEFSASPNQSWAVGDNYDTDLEPAKSLGMVTFQIGSRKGEPDFRFPDFNSFLDFLLSM